MNSILRAVIEEQVATQEEGTHLITRTWVLRKETQLGRAHWVGQYKHGKHKVEDAPDFIVVNTILKMHSEERPWCFA